MVQRLTSYESYYGIIEMSRDWFGVSNTQRPCKRFYGTTIAEDNLQISSHLSATPETFRATLFGLEMANLKRSLTPPSNTDSHLATSGAV